MSCDDCDKVDELNMVAYYRWGSATVGIVSCEKHFREIRDALNEVQNGK